MRYYVKINHIDPDAPFSVMGIDSDGSESLFDVFKSLRQAKEFADLQNNRSVGVEDSE